MLVLYIIIAIIVVIVIYAITTYNNFVKLNTQVQEAFSTMDIYLKKRWDLIPNLVEVVKGYAKYENETLKEIVELRNSAYSKMSASEKLDANNKVSIELNKVLAISENYPELKANENFKDLNQQLEKIEEDIANSRKYYNGTVKLYNNSVLMFPSNMVASLLGYKEQKMFEVDDKEKENLKIELEKKDETRS